MATRTTEYSLSNEQATVDLRNRRLTVMGKGSKERMVPISARTAQAVWRYLAEWGETRKAEVLFPT